MNETITDTNLDRKATILHTATKLFSQLGFYGVSIRQICKAAGCNMAAISYYFGGKEKLYNACLKQVDERFIKQIKMILAPAESKEELESKLITFGEIFSQLVEEHAQPMRLLVGKLNSEAWDQIPEAESVISPILLRLEEFFSAGQKNGLIAQHIEPKITSRMVCFVLLSQMLYQTMRPFNDITKEEFIKKVVKNTTGAFYA